MPAMQHVGPLCSRRLLRTSVTTSLKLIQAVGKPQRRNVKQLQRRSFHIASALQTDILSTISNHLPSWLRKRLGLKPDSTKATPPQVFDSETSPGQARHMNEVFEVFENQRYYGFSWGASALLDRAEWSDGDGNPVVLPSEFKPDETDGWQVEVGPQTDDEGWQYGTTFHHLSYDREGGRASNRPADMVRRRLWKKKELAWESSQHAYVIKQGPDTTQDDRRLSKAERRRVRIEAEEKAQKKAIDSFIKLVFDLVERRQLWSILPWDPSAWPVMYWNHIDRFKDMREKQMKNAILTPDEDCAPSILHGPNGTLLQDLLAATIHARAAYGYAMMAGYMSSIMSYLYLQTVQKLSFDAAGGASIAANNEAVAALAGVQLDDIISARWTTGTYRPCHYVAIDKSNRCIVVAIRGTLEVGDVLSDLSANPTKVRCGAHEGWVHEGMFAAAQHVLEEVEQPIKEAVHCCPGWPLLITGHSLGAGVASLLTLLLSAVDLPACAGPIRCIAVAPAATMSKEMAQACKGITTSIVLGADVVPRLSYASVESLLLEAVDSGVLKQAASTVSATVMKSVSLLSLMGDQTQQQTEEEGATNNTLLSSIKKTGSKLPGLRSVLSMSKDEASVERAAAAATAAVGPQDSRGGPSPHLDSSPTTTQGPNGGTVDAPDGPHHSTSQPHSEHHNQGAHDTARGPPDRSSSEAGRKMSESWGELAGSSGVEVLGQEELEGREQGSRQQAMAQATNDPQLLFPAGRIIWLLPNEEGVDKDISDMDKTGMAQRKQDIDQQANNNTAGSGCSNTDEVEDDEEAAEKLQVVAVDADLDSFKDIFVLPNMINYHLPDNYLEALQSL